MIRPLIVSSNLQKDYPDILNLVEYQFNKKFSSTGFGCRDDTSSQDDTFDRLRQIVLFDKRGEASDTQISKYATELAKDFRYNNFLSRMRRVNFRHVTPEYLIPVSIKSTLFDEYLDIRLYRHNFRLFTVHLIRNVYFSPDFDSGKVFHQPALTIYVNREFSFFLKLIIFKNGKNNELWKHRMLNFYIEQLFEAADIAVKAIRLIDFIGKT